MAGMSVTSRIFSILSFLKLVPGLKNKWMDRTAMLLWILLAAIIGVFRKIKYNKITLLIQLHCLLFCVLLLQQLAFLSPFGISLLPLAFFNSKICINFSTKLWNKVFWRNGKIVFQNKCFAKGDFACNIHFARNIIKIKDNLFFCKFKTKYLPKKPFVLVFLHL